MRKIRALALLAAIILLPVILLVSAEWTGLPALLVAWGVGVLSVVFVASLIQDLYGGSTRRAFEHLLTLLVPGAARAVTVEDGKRRNADIAQEKGPAYGPRPLHVKPENAVVTVHNDTHMLYGPGRYQLKPFEEIRYIYDLRMRHRTYVFDDVLSKDRFLAAFHVSAAYAPAVHYRKQPETINLAASDPEGAMLQLLAQPNWETTAKLAVERAIRRHALSMEMENILTKPDTRDFDAAEQAVRDESTRSLADRGIFLRYVDIEAIVPKPGSPVAPEAGWKERSRLEGIQECLIALAEGTKRLAPRAPERFETGVREMLKSLRGKPANEPVFSPEMNRRLQDFQ